MLQRGTCTIPLSIFQGHLLEFVLSERRSLLWLPEVCLFRQVSCSIQQSASPFNLRYHFVCYSRIPGVTKLIAFCLFFRVRSVHRTSNRHVTEIIASTRCLPSKMSSQVGLQDPRFRFANR